jgi:uncharacterized protein
MNPYPIIDLHQHSGPWPLPGRWGGVEENLRLNALRGIDKAIISSTLAIVQDMPAGNAELAEQIAGQPSLYAYVTVNPTVRADSERELSRYEGNPQFVGAKIHTNYSGCAMGDPRIATMLGVLQEWGRPLLIHTWGLAEVNALRALAMRYPRLRIVMAHTGGDAWRDGIAAAQVCPNLTLDFACSTPYRAAVARALATLGPERVAFGSDSTLFDPLYMRAVFDHVLMDDTARCLVMGGNAARLFELRDF